jgi:hypothetical protein
MIILRKLGRQSDCRFVMADELVGLADGVNQTFAVSYEYTPGKIEIMYNGQLLTSPYDFDEYGADEPTASGLEPNEIRFVYLKPTDLTVLRANYQVGNCADGSYDGPGGIIPGATSFIELTDTPTTYSGFENNYLKINAAGDGIEFVASVGDTSGIVEGIEPVVSGTTSVSVTFTSAITADYVVTASLENTGDAETSIYPILIKNKTVMGFTAEFSGEIDTDNYRLHWRVTDPNAVVSTSSSNFGLSTVSYESSPELGGDIDLGDDLIILDTKPNGMTAHGYEVGSSGEASVMEVFDNPTGFACPLYMRPDGKWGPCSAAAGLNQMPCTALALEEDEGLKKIFWKGNIRKGNWNWTPGQKIYVSTVEGAITNVKPNGGSWPQVIGVAISKDTIRFDPDLTTENPNGGN